MRSREAKGASLHYDCSGEQTRMRIGSPSGTGLCRQTPGDGEAGGRERLSHCVRWKPSTHSQPSPPARVVTTARCPLETLPTDTGISSIA